MDRSEYIDIENDETNIEVFNRIRLLGFAKNVKFYSVLEAVFDFYIGIFMFWPFMFLGALSLCGFYGSKRYDAKLIYAYYVGDIIKLVFKLILVLYTQYIGTLIITWIMCFLSLIYIITIKRFYDELKNASLDELIQLRSGWQPRIVHFVF
tara:strand:- start:2919 stop:3371 length:453 start_codon:yes stop_codon:yes gene_type:complete